MKYLFSLLVMLIFYVSGYPQSTCDNPLIFNDNTCIFYSPPTAGPITRCFRFYIVDDSVSFSFTPYGPVGTCLDYIESYDLYDGNCSLIETNNSGFFLNLLPNNFYTVCYTIQCPTDGVVNLLCTVELITLPVKLLYFTAENINGKLTLLWSTAIEINNLGFVIERSTDLSLWKNIGFIEGNGYSNTIINYDFVDDSPINGINYYRLKQIDNNNNYEIHNTIAVLWSNKNEYNIFRMYNILGQRIR